MGAAMTQRPELFGAIWCGYPLLDMLRYQKFLIGRTWTTEYGNTENPADFAYIDKYSPYRHVVPGTKYPAILFFTGDGDTRVDPMNARKMTPLMQESSASGRPILLHYSLKGGHSAGVSQTQTHRRLRRRNVLPLDLKPNDPCKAHIRLSETYSFAKSLNNCRKTTEVGFQSPRMA